jgi:hypothetical protein
LIISYIGENVAGSPTDPAVKWTHLQPRDIAKFLYETHQLTISHRCIKRILKANGFVRRKPLKAVAEGKSPYREAQFLMIFAFLKIFKRMPHNPIISIDKKDTELLGNLTRNAPVLCEKGHPVKVYTHDFQNNATGKAVPLGIYDVKQNKGFMTLGNSRETADFIIDNLLYWWLNHGKIDYPNADNILIFCDGGGGNGHRHFRFKQRLQDLAKTIGIKITIVHYPPYCSKYNPIEHRLFCHVERAIKDCILTDLDQMKDLIERTTSTGGLTISVRIHLFDYPLKQPSDKNLINPKRIVYAKTLPIFNYIILP